MQENNLFMDKEATVFVVDTGPLADPAGIDYVLAVYAEKLQRGLKTDLIAVLAYNSPITSHAVADLGKFPGIDVISELQAPHFEALAALKLKLVANEDAGISDAFKALVFSISLFDVTKNKKFKRNLVFVGNATSAIEERSLDKVPALAQLLDALPVNLVVLGDVPERSHWERVGEKFLQLALLLKEEHYLLPELHPPVKKTRPLPVYRGELRFGSDIRRHLQDSAFVAAQDDNCLTFRVEVYPAAKSEVALTTSFREYVVLDDTQTPVKVERHTRHFVWQKKQATSESSKPETWDGAFDEKLFDKIYIDKQQMAPGFRFLNFDVVALDDALMLAARLEISPEFDIWGLTKASSVPQEYFTDETFYVVPEASSSFRNLVNHAAFCEALLRADAAPLVRFVRKLAKEVEVGVLLPVKIRKRTPAETQDPLEAYAFIYVRLPFSEDMKIGRFPKIALKLSDTSSAMDDFVRAMTIGEKKEIHPPLIDVKKVTMLSSEASKLPLFSEFEERNLFLANSPAINKHAIYMRRLLIAAAGGQVTLESIQSGTNFFNLENILTVNVREPDFLLPLASAQAKRLREVLELVYVRKEDTKKQKTAKLDVYLQNRGNYGAEEKSYGEVPDFGF